MRKNLRIRFHFDEKKTAQAAAHLLERHGGNLSMFRLIKLLYLADRQALLETGMTLTGDRMVSMDKGPVLSKVYDLIKKGDPHESPDWFELITPPNRHTLSLARQRPPKDELSDYEIEILDAVDRRFGHMDVRLLIQFLHSLGEWTDPHGSSVAISPERILEAERRSAGEIERVAENAEELWGLESIKRTSH